MTTTDGNILHEAESAIGTRTGGCEPGGTIPPIVGLYPGGPRAGKRAAGLLSVESVDYEG